jgi:cell surface protein SprA
MEKVGDDWYRKPTYLSFEEMYKLQAEQSERAYFAERSQTLFDLNRKVLRPKPRAYENLFDRIFGLGPEGLRVDIKPQGSMDVFLGYMGQNIKNPTLPEQARRNGGLDFNMNTNLNLNANIGDKLKLPINYNTLANFDFENQLKLDYRGKDDEIIKSIEAGTISFQSKGSLMSSAQSLFGVKTQLQFGKLFITAALANQRSQRQSVALQGGGLSQQINKRLDDYDENRHFLLAQYFRNQYNTAMSQLPLINSLVQILRMEVWVTNRTGTAINTRSIVGFMDLGERNPYNPNLTSTTSSDLPENNSNDLYSFLTNNPSGRDPALINSILTAKGLEPVNDYEKTFARKLDSTEYYYNPQVGFLSLNVQVQPDEVIGVAYQYSYNGKIYQVGEFSQDITLDTAAGNEGIQKNLFLKLLKATSQRVDLPIWDLMMKNVYSLDVSGLQQQDFRLNVLYQEPSGGVKRFLPESSPEVAGKPLITILNADRLNNRNDPQPDGLYDFLDGYTVIAQQGKVIFPVLEPFGADLERLAFSGQPQEVKEKYIYNQLYDTIKAIAQTYANLNRYLLQGTIKGSSNSDIYLGGFNIPPGSVTVSAGGQMLQENVDYVIDYNLGTLKILNQAIINSGVPVNVQYENNAGFGIQQRSFFGLRLDYLVNKKLTLGATMQRLAERPFFTKMNYGDDPIRNMMYGVDFSYQSEFPALTRLLDKLPFYTTTAPSSITAYGEAALLQPGHPRQIGQGDQGLIYIDDFEGTRSSVDLRFPFVAWTMASTPQGNGRFPEATSTNSLAYGTNRAKLAWYNIEPSLQDKNSPANPLRSNLNELSDPRVRQLLTNQLFPQRTTNITDVLNSTFDLAYYPTERGPYNFVTDPTEVDGNGKLNNPRKRWAGIMRNIDQTDFETGNIEYIEFWMQDPFITNRNSQGGKLFINLGNISEDILKDGRRFYENGIASPTQPSAVDSLKSVWGKVPTNPIQITQAFSNEPNDRPFQDVGFDGLRDEEERQKQSAYLNELSTNFGVSSIIFQQANADPSNDNYIWYRDAGYDNQGTGILGRYKNFNNQQGNSPVVENNSSQFTPASTLYPDNEDLNRDNTLNEVEEYFEYEIDLRNRLGVGATKYITDSIKINGALANGQPITDESWYLFRVPIKDFTNKVGRIPDFKSIRFIRLYMTDFADSVVLRFASFDLVRNQWRTFQFLLDTTGNYTPVPTGGTSFNVLAVNVEENSSRSPIPYRIPPGIERVQQLSNNGINLLQNEQAMSLQVNNLQTGDARAVFKNTNLDLRQYGKLSMFLHAEKLVNNPLDLQDGELTAVVRIGQDFLNNYYEIKIPLKVTNPSEGISPEAIWPEENNLDFLMQDLVSLKLRRNGLLINPSQIYREQIGNKTFSVKGNPNLGEVQGFLVGVENNSGQVKSAEVWVNELRLSRLDEEGGYAALGRVDMQLADLGTLSVSANTYTAGFGTIEQQVNERARQNLLQFDAALSIDAGKLLPKKAGITIPVFASINKTIITPEYDPYDLDLDFKEKLKTPGLDKDSARRAALDETTIKTLNFTNVRFAQNTRKPAPWRLSNFDFSYSVTQFTQTSPIITINQLTKHRAGLGYNYTASSKFIEPFKKWIKNKSIWLTPIKDLNFNPLPSLISFRADVNRQFGRFVPRIVNSFDNTVERVDTTYDKYFTFDRYYNLRWDLTRALNIDFSATNFARVDEPFGALDNKFKKDSVRDNFLDGGRNTLYQQRATLSYNFPLNKLPITDWITARYNYTTTYNWIGASLLAVNLGNTIENSQQNGLTGEFDLTRLYSKIPWLDKISTATASPRGDDDNQLLDDEPVNGSAADTMQAPKPRAEVIKNKKGFEKRNALQKWRQYKRDYRITHRKAKVRDEVSAPLRLTGQMVTMLKRASLNYSENYNSRLPGYSDSTRYVGQDWKSMQPGLDYVFGKQPDTSWLNRKAAEGVITRDSLFSQLFTQNFQQQLTITAQLEPVRELNIDINLQKTFSKTYSELFKDTTAGGGKTPQHLSPLATGGFNVSFISFQTLFQKTNPNQVSETFNIFQSNRIIIANKLANANPYWQQLPADEKFQPDSFPTGYGRYSQDVLIPAFIAAYTGKEPLSAPTIVQQNPNIKANPFRALKALPNWRLTYTGLSRLPGLSDVFSNITITHGYTGSLSMNSFNSALLYADPFKLGAPAFINPQSGNYEPFFLVPNITIQEQFSPLIGIDITTNNQTSIRFEYAKSRQLSLSMFDFQLAEVRSTSFTFGGTYRKRGATLPFKIPFVKPDPEQTDLGFSLDLALRDDIQSNSRLDQPNAYGTGGQKVITISPAIDYVVNSRVNLRLYFDQQRTLPYIQTSAPITNTRAGLQIRVSLAP